MIRPLGGAAADIREEAEGPRAETRGASESDGWPASERRFAIYLAVVTGILIAAMLLSVAIGSVPLSLRSVVAAIAEGIVPWRSRTAGAAAAPVSPSYGSCGCRGL
jgi:hypothetical protein